MNTFDLFIFIPVALGLIFGLFKGFVKEVVSLGAIVLAIFVAEFLTGRISPFVGNWFNLSPKMATTVSYILIFFITVILAFLISNMTNKLLKNINLGWLNGLLGGLFGALKIAIVVSVLMNVFDALDSKFQFANQEKKEASLGYYPVLKLAPSLWKEAKKTYDENKNKQLNSQQQNEASV